MICCKVKNKRKSYNHFSIPCPPCINTFIKWFDRIPIHLQKKYKQRDFRHYALSIFRIEEKKNESQNMFGFIICNLQRTHSRFRWKQFWQTRNDQIFMHFFLFWSRFPSNYHALLSYFFYIFLTIIWHFISQFDINRKPLNIICVCFSGEFSFYYIKLIIDAKKKHW